MQNFYIACYVIGIISTIVSTIACPIIADRKGRSIGGWIVGGLLLGFLGLIIIGSLSDKTPAQRVVETPTADYLKPKKHRVYCPNCGQYITRESGGRLICPFCGDAFISGQAFEGKTSNTAKEKGARCPYCGQKTSQKSDNGTEYYCQSCGEWFEPTKDNQ